MNQEPVVLNSFILRDALLNSADTLARLGLKVVDLTKEPQPVKEEPISEPESVEATPPKKSSKKKKEEDETWE
jgi:hypothetical protein